MAPRSKFLPEGRTMTMIVATSGKPVRIHELAHEIADSIVNLNGYADDDSRADERDRIEGIILNTLKTEICNG
jgi:hypothetical protein